MGKKWGWFSAVRKALISSDSKEKKDKKSQKSKTKKSWDDEKQKNLDEEISQPEVTSENSDKGKHTTTNDTYSPTNDATMAAEVAVVSPPPDTRFLGKSKEEIAAIKIQTAYRCFLARRTLRALRGLGRLKSLIQGQSVKRQATSTLRCMQTLARVQSQVRARRIRMSQENQVLQRQLLQKREKELDDIRASLGNTWDDSILSKEQIEAGLRSKHEAAIKRERALAYAHSHQQMWRNSKTANPTFMDPNNPHWGWSWLERWMAARPWETESTTDKEPDTSRGSIKSMSRSTSTGGIAKRLNRGPSRQSPSKAPSEAAADDDSRSLYSVQSERYRRHSVASSPVCDVESLASSPRTQARAPGSAGSTKSVKARSRMASPSPSPSPLGSGKKETLDQGSAKKRLLFSGSPSTGHVRRLSGPPRMDSKSVKDVNVDP